LAARTGALAGQLLRLALPSRCPFANRHAQIILALRLPLPG
jgi:hypothetical protein